MSARCSTLLAAVIAAVCLSAGVASAGRLSSSSTTFRATWSAWRVTGFWEGSEVVSIRCPLTLRGTFHARTITKASGTLVAAVEPNGFAGIDAGNCTNGRPFLLSESWHLRYESFTGTLPTIASLAFELVGLDYSWTFTGIASRCLYATASAPARLTTTLERGAITSVRWDESRRFPKLSGDVLCPREVSYSGAGTLTEETTTTAIRVSLI